MRAAFRRTAVTVLSSAVLAAGGIAGSPAASASVPATPGESAESAVSFTVAWVEHPVEESGYVSYVERVTLTNAGKSTLTLVKVGADGVPFTGVTSECVIAPGESCRVGVAWPFLGGDYPEVMTTTLFATMRTDAGTEITQTQALRLPVVDTPPWEPYAVQVPAGDYDPADRPAVCLSTPSERNRIIEPSTMVALVSDRFGDLLAADNPAMQQSNRWEYYCERAWELRDSALADAPTTDVVHMTYVDDEGNRVTTDYPLTYPAPTEPPEPPQPQQPPVEARLVADPSTLAETGEVAHLTLTVRNPRTVPAVLEHLVTRAGRDLAVERDQPKTGTVCTGSLTLAPGESLVCRYTSPNPLVGQAGTTQRATVTLSGPDVAAVAETDLTFRDVPPDARVTLARPAAGGLAVTVTGMSAEPGVIEGIDVLSLADMGSSTCTPGARLTRDATYSCTIGGAPTQPGAPADPSAAWPMSPLAFLPVVVAVQVKDDDGTRATAYGWSFPTS